MPSVTIFTILILFAWTETVKTLTYRTREHTASFDDLITKPKSQNLLGIYDSLNWNYFSLMTQDEDIGLDIVSGITPASGRSVAVGIAPSPVEAPTISAALMFTNVVFFDLHGFYWGCIVQNSHRHVPLQPETPANCSLTLRCYEPSRPGREPNKVASYFFLVTSVMRIWGVPMMRVFLNAKFTACGHVEWDVKSLSGKEVALVLDDVQYKTYTVTGWGWQGVGAVEHENGPYGIA